MCHRSRIWGIILLAVGAGFIISCLFGSWFIRLLIGAVLVALSFLFCR